MSARNGRDGVCTCPRCGVTYSGGGGGHCMACHRTFTSDSTAAAHRAGPYEDRHCVDVTTVDGWRETPRGWTNSPPMPEHLRART